MPAPRTTRPQFARLDVIVRLVPQPARIEEFHRQHSAVPRSGGETRSLITLGAVVAV